MPTGWPAYRLLARVFAVKAILHGHTHDHLDRRVNNVRIVGTKDSTVANWSGLLSFKTYAFYPDSALLKAQIRRVRAV